MARYYLNIIDGETYIEDEEGLERPNLESARQEAVRGLRAIIASEVASGRLNLDVRIVIHDERGEISSLSGHDAVQALRS